MVLLYINNVYNNWVGVYF